MAKSFNITPTLKKNAVTEPTLTAKTTFKKTLKDVEVIKEKVEKIHQDEIETAAISRAVGEEIVEEIPVETITPTVIEKPVKAAAKATAKKARTQNATTVLSEDSKRMTVVMPKETHRLLKIKAINGEITLNEFIVNLIEKNLGIR